MPEKTLLFLISSRLTGNGNPEKQVYMPSQFGLIGYPIHASRSPEWFTQAFCWAGWSGCSYDLFPLDTIDKLPALIRQRPLLRGFNVTIPYKERVIPYLDRLDSHAEAIGAVNVVLIRDENGKRFLHGFNTDAGGFSRSADFTPYERALVLGTGGAAKAIAYALKRLGKKVTLVSRQKGVSGGITYEDIDQVLILDHLLIINATPIGMAPATKSAPALPYQFLTPRHFLYDTVYFPNETLFLKKGKINGTRTLSGLRMLREQAGLSFTLFSQALDPE